MYNSTLTIAPSSVISKDLDVGLQIVESINSDYLSVSDTNLIEYSVLASKQIKERKKRYAKAAEMMRSWASEDPEYDEKAWSYLEKELQDASIKLKKDHGCD